MKIFPANIRFWLLTLFVLPATLTAATISGTVTDTSATPIAGAKVILSIVGAGGPVKVDSAITNALGQYTLINVAVGNKILQASATGYVTGNAVLNVANATGSYTTNFTLISSVGGATGTVSGTVIQIGTLTPIAGVLVRLFNVTLGVLDSVVTNALGQYTLASVPVGAGYSIVVTHPGHNTQLRNAITIAANVTSTQNFTLQITATIRGTVTNSVDTLPVAGARVILTLPSSATFVPETTFTTARGAYSFDSVGNGNQYLITVSAAGFQTAINNTVTITDARRSGLADFSLVPITIGTTGSITGLIASANSGVPIAGARVILTRGGFTPDTVFTNGSGQYIFNSIPAQTGYTITVSAATYNQAVRANVAVVSGQTTVADINLLSATGVEPSSGSIAAYKAGWMNGTLTLRLSPSDRVRKVEAYGPNGALRQNMTVPAGQTKVVFPGEITAGTLFRIR